MQEAIISDEIFGLGAFSTAWTTEQEEDMRFGEDSIILLLFLRDKIKRYLRATTTHFKNFEYYKESTLDDLNSKIFKPKV